MPVWQRWENRRASAFRAVELTIDGKRHLVIERSLRAGEPIVRTSHRHHTTVNGAVQAVAKQAHQLAEGGYERAGDVEQPIPDAIGEITTEMAAAHPLWPGYVAALAEIGIDARRSYADQADRSHGPSAHDHRERDRELRATATLRVARTVLGRAPTEPFRGDGEHDLGVDLLAEHWPSPTAVFIAALEERRRRGE